MLFFISRKKLIYKSIIKKTDCIERNLNPANLLYSEKKEIRTSKIAISQSNTVQYIQKQESEKCGYTPEDLQSALNHCGDSNPVTWLNDNWQNMIETVVTLATNVGHEAEENTIGTLSKPEAKEALRKHKGNIWAAVTECVEQRQAKVSFTGVFVIRADMLIK